MLYLGLTPRGPFIGTRLSLSAGRERQPTWVRITQVVLFLTIWWIACEVMLP